MGCQAVGLLPEAAHAEDRLAAGAVGARAPLDVAVAGVGLGRRDAQDHHGLFARSGGCGRAHYSLEAPLVADGVVGRKDGQQGVFLPAGQGSAHLLGGQSDGRRRVAPQGLEQEVARRHPRQLLAQQRAVLGVRHH